MLRIFRHYWPEIKKYRFLVILMVLSLAVAVVGDLIIPYLLREFANLLAGTFNEAPENAMSMFDILWKMAGLYAIVWVLWRVNEYSLVVFETKSMRDMENRAFEVLHKQSVKFFKDAFTGSLVKKVYRFTNSFEDLADIIYFQFLQQFLKITIIFTVFMMERPVLGFIFLVWAVIFLIGSYLFATWKLKYDIEAAKADSKIGAVLADSLGNYGSVKTFAREDDEAERFGTFSETRFQKRKFSWNLHTHASTVQAFVMISFELILFYFVIRWWKQGVFTVGDFIFLQAYLLVLFHGLWDFSRHIQRTFERLADAKEMVDIFEQDIDVKDIPYAKKLNIKKGEIEIRNVEFSFEENYEKLFAHFNLKIPAGQQVALVGPSGAGKSTIVNLIFRFYDIQKGEIFIDGQNIADVTQKSLRKNISLVPQNPELFHRTLAENIAFGKPDATREEIKEAAHKAHANEFIKKFQEGYDTLVGERGVKLSGGEKQRIAIARAFLENAPILVLDEATSALDSLTEKKIQDAIFTLMENRTSIVIAHRLSTILHMDRILVIENGEIVEDGSHRQLLNKNGLYAKLWHHQAGGFIGES